MAKLKSDKEKKAGTKKSGQVQMSAGENQEPKKDRSVSLRKTRADSVFVEITAATVVNRSVVRAGKVLEVSTNEANKLFSMRKAKPSTQIHHEEDASELIDSGSEAINPEAPEESESEESTDNEGEGSSDE